MTWDDRRLFRAGAPLRRKVIGASLSFRRPQAL
jgi:hypothetical protein